MTMALTKDWTDHFTSLEKSRWPGPRPLRDGDVIGEDGNPVPDGPLQGRDDDADEFLSAVLDHLMVVLTAESGVGKTSLINTRLIPQLEMSGYSVASKHSWTDDTNQTVKERLDYLVRTLPRATAEADFVTDTRVLVLDQFEELIRFSASDAREAYEWLERTNQRDTLRVVISLRAEYLHHLRNVERKARPFSFAMIQLEPIVNEETIEQIVSSRRAGTPDGLAELGSHFAAEVRDLCGDQGDNEVGLIDLQALLWELDLRHQADGLECNAAHHGGGDGKIEKSCLDDMCEPGGSNIFATAVRLAVARKLRHCVASSEKAGYDSVVSAGAHALAYEFMPKLASGDFKVQVDEFSAARQLLAREVAQSGLDARELQTLFELVTDQVGHTKVWPEAVAEWDIGEAIHLDPDHVDWATWRTDERFLSSGVMFGMHPVAVLYQRLRQFCLAMAWLEAADLVRATRSRPGEAKLALIHDRLAGAVDELGSGWLPTFANLRSRVSSTRGQDLAWRPQDDGPGANRSGPSRQAVDNEVVANARWQDCTVRDADLHQVMLVNCDLRGSRFDHCTFEGVSFVNCLLDNVTFERCSIKGHLDSTTPVQPVSRLPDFQVKDENSAPLLKLYRSLPGVVDVTSWRESTALLYSRTSGVAAVPLGEGQDAPVIEAQNGGLAIHGGRLGSLMFVSTIFDDDAPEQPGAQVPPALGLFDITGASLDIVEQKGGPIRVVRSLIRGLTVSTTPGSDPYGLQALTLMLEDSVLANTWIGHGVTGVAKLVDSVAVQLVNLNPVTDFAIDNATNDPLTGAFVDETVLAAELEAYADNQAGGWNDVVEMFSKMDFRSRPAQMELDPNWLESD